MNKKIIISACLLGLRCRYDKKDKLEKKIINLKNKILIPVCPEQLGGLSTPREAVEINKGKALTKSGKDVTKNLKDGAKEVLFIAKKLGVKCAILKQKSPSCGCGKIYDGTFSKKIINGFGFTASLLKKNGIKVVTEEDL